MGPRPRAVSNSEREAATRCSEERGAVNKTIRATVLGRIRQREQTEGQRSIREGNDTSRSPDSVFWGQTIERDCARGCISPEGAPPLEGSKNREQHSGSP